MVENQVNYLIAHFEAIHSQGVEKTLAELRSRTSNLQYLSR